jgi:uncharacterized protein (TIGR01777 family)
MSHFPKPAGRIVIAGGTGFLGMNLARHLTDRGCEVVLISRNAPAEDGPWKHSTWDGRNLGEWMQHLDGASALVNLAGRSVDCIKTPDHCDEILRSRVEATQVLGRALQVIETPPPVWVQMSTAHIYGDPSAGIQCTEDSALGYGLAPDVARAWEDAYSRSVLPQMRQVIARTSFVLGRNGGAVHRLALLARWGLGGTVGRGSQGISWIHEEDMNHFLVRAITDDQLSGPYIVTAPNPVSNREFMRELRRAFGRPFGLPAAGWMVRLGARWIMRTDPELALYGRYCVSRRLREEGFEFRFADLQSALDDLM